MIALKKVPSWTRPRLSEHFGVAVGRGVFTVGVGSGVSASVGTAVAVGVQVAGTGVGVDDDAGEGLGGGTVVLVTVGVGAANVTVGSAPAHAATKAPMNSTKKGIHVLEIRGSDD
jgi:hypothetical protein